MKSTLVLVRDRAEWTKRFGHLPAHPLLTYEGDGLYHKKSGIYDDTQRTELCMPYVIPDVPAHIGPSGRIVNSRFDQRDEYKRSGTTQFERIEKRPRGFIDPAVCKARGIGPCEATLEWMRQKKKEVADGTYVKPIKLDRAAQRRVENAQREVLVKHGIT